MNGPVDAPAHERRLRQLAELPEPAAWPLVGRSFGHLMQLRAASMHRQMEAWADRLGPWFRVRFGPTPVLGLADPDAIQAALKARPETFGRAARLREIGEEMGALPGLFSAEGESWRRQRKLVMAAFAPGHVRAYAPALRAVALRLHARWQAAARAGRAIELADDLKRYTVDAIAGLAFGVTVDTLGSGADNRIQRHLDVVLAGLYRRAMSPLPTWRWWSSARERRLEASVAALRESIAALVAQARTRLAADPARQRQPANVLEAMLMASDAPGSGLDDADVAGNVSTLLFAGEDTTANSLAWLIWLLARHPQALARAQAEMRALLPDAAALATLDVDALARLDWLDACIHESMRLKPVAPFLVLQALHDTVLADVALPAGTLVWCLLRHPATDSARIDDAARFEPARWLAGGALAEAAGPRRASLPFGSGARICPGRYLALIEMRLALAVLLAGFEIDAVDAADGASVRETMQFTMNPSPLRMRLRERGA